MRNIPFHERVQYCVDKVKGQSELARLVSKFAGRKVSPQSIQYLVNPRKKVPAKGSRLTAAIAKAANVDVDWLASGEGSPEHFIGTQEPEMAYGSKRHMKTAIKTAEGSYRLPKFNVSVSAGGGHYYQEHEEVIDQLTITGDWIRKNLSITGIQNLAVLTAYGDSMEDTFSSGDPLLVDRGVREVKIDSVYVLQRDDELFVKRIQRQLDGDLIIISDNKKYEPQTVSNGSKSNLQVLGRVVYCWNGKKL
jgi:phage repressor protein C with HTH and peptisase S24 domain